MANNTPFEKANKIEIDNNEIEKITKITLPDNWWHSQNSYEHHLKKNTARIININSSKQDSLPRANNWEIAEGDYSKEEDKSYPDYNPKSNNSKLIIFLAVILVASAVILFFVLKFVALYSSTID